MAETVGFAVCVDFDEGFGHAVKAKGMKLIEGRMIEQDYLS